MATVIAFHFPHKAASMFAFQILDGMAQRTGFGLFSQNVRPQSHADITKLETQKIDGTYLRGPVRNFTIASSRTIRDPGDYRFVTTRELLASCRYRAVCQTRDVLDLVVSQYFSHGWIHPPDKSGMRLRSELQAGRISVFDYALLEFDGRAEFGQDSIIKKLRDLETLKKALGPNCLVVRYEDMMLNYDQWSAQIADFLQHDVPIAGDVLQACRRQYGAPPESMEFFPDPLEYVRKYQHQFEHVRSPHPGDHRRFLTSAEISSLRDAVESALAAVS